MDNYFEFDGRRSTDFGLYVERYPVQPKPQRQVEVIDVPGRSGVLHYYPGGYNNVTIPYECYFRGGPEQASEIAAWLYGAAGGYKVLRDTYHPGVFRRAAFDGPLDLENIWNRYGRCTLEFDCAPQLWTDAGQQPVEFDLPISSTGSWSFDTAAVGLLYNPYPFAAKPLIYIEGYGRNVVTIRSQEGRESHLSCETGPYAEIDCELQNMYKDDLNQNTYLDVTAEFPALEPGENIILMSRTAQPATSDSPYRPRLVITPRWWHL